MIFTDIFDENRRLIPRWHTFKMAKAFRGLMATRPLTPSIKLAKERHDKKLNDWKIFEAVPFAVEYLASSYALNEFSSSHAIRAAQFLLKRSDCVSSFVIELAQSFMNLANALPEKNDTSGHLSKKEDFNKGISLMKKEVRSYPRDHIRWIDLAFFYSAIGQNHKSEKCTEIALALNSENRFVLRSSSRFFLHIDKPEKALYFLRKSANAKTDPWLIACEISISDSFRIKPQHIKRGKQALESPDLSPFSKSELAGTIGTLEIFNGALKKGKKLFKSALIDPTENTIAQAVWLSQIENLDLG